MSAMVAAQSLHAAAVDLGQEVGGAYISSVKEAGD